MRLRIACIAVLSCAAACSTDTTSSSSFSVGGQVTGLTGSLTLANNTTDNLTVTGTGAFTFAKTLNANDTYSVTVVTQPTGETCTVTDGTGTVANANVTSIKVACTSNSGTKYTVGGSLTGLTAGAGTVVLTNGSDQVNVTASGSFVFPTSVATDSNYNVSVLSTPASYSCTVSSGTGKVGNANVTSVGVACTYSAGPGTSTYSLGGHVNGLATAGGTITLHNGSDSKAVSADGDFTLSTGLATGATYHVTVTGAAPGYACTVDNPNGTIASSNVTNVTVTCAAQSFKVSGTVSGQTGDFTVVDNAANTSVAVPHTGSTFEITGYAYGTDYDIQVTTPPTGQICNVQNGSGLVCTADVTDVVITCGTAVSVGGSVSGQTGDFVVAVNGSHQTTVANGHTTYTVPNLLDGTPYSVTIDSHPAGQKCLVASHAGTFSGSASGVNITCSDAATVSGAFPAAAAGLILSVSDGSDYEVVQIPSAQSTYSIPIKKANGSWSIYVLASPRGQSCSINQTNGINTGSNISTNVTGVDITCQDKTYTVSGIIRVASGSSGVVEITDGFSSVSKSNNNDGWGFSDYAEGDTVNVSYSIVSGFTSCTQVPSQAAFTLGTNDIGGIIINCQ